MSYNEWQRRRCYDILSYEGVNIRTSMVCRWSPDRPTFFALHYNLLFFFFLRKKKKRKKMHNCLYSIKPFVQLKEYLTMRSNFWSYLL